MIDQTYAFRPGQGERRSSGPGAIHGCTSQSTARSLEYGAPLTLAMKMERETVDNETKVWKRMTESIEEKAGWIDHGTFPMFYTRAHPYLRHVVK